MKKKTDVDFDDVMSRLMRLPSERAQEIVKRTAPAKPKAQREGEALPTRKRAKKKAKKK